MHVHSSCSNWQNNPRRQLDENSTCRIWFDNWWKSYLCYLSWYTILCWILDYLSIKSNRITIHCQNHNQALNSDISWNLFFMIQVFWWTTIMIILMYCMIVFFLNVIIQSISYPSNFINKNLSCNHVCIGHRLKNMSWDIQKIYAFIVQNDLISSSVAISCLSCPRRSFIRVCWIFPVLFLKKRNLTALLIYWLLFVSAESIPKTMINDEQWANEKRGNRKSVDRNVVPYSKLRLKNEWHRLFKCLVFSQRKNWTLSDLSTSFGGLTVRKTYSSKSGLKV